MASDRRARKRLRVLEQWALDERASAEALAFNMVACDRCGLVQDHATAGNDYEFVLPCPGPLGIPCGSETCQPADYFLTWNVAQ